MCCGGHLFATTLTGQRKRPARGGPQKLKLLLSGCEEARAPHRITGSRETQLAGRVNPKCDLLAVEGGQGVSEKAAVNCCLEFFSTGQVRSAASPRSLSVTPTCTVVPARAMCNRCDSGIPRLGFEQAKRVARCLEQRHPNPSDEQREDEQEFVTESARLRLQRVACP